MFRYFTLVWPAENEHAASVAALVRQRLLGRDLTWKAVLQAPGLEAFCAGISPGSGGVLPLSGHPGAFLGTLFHSSSSHRVYDLGDSASQRLLDSQGKAAIESYWGSYVLVLLERTAHRVTILRGPLSSLPCFWAVYRGVTLIFSCVDDCLSLGFLRFAIDWDCICAQVVGGDYLARQTALLGLETLISGEALHVTDAARTCTTYWSPSCLSPEPPVRDFAKASRLLRQTTETCIHGWLSSHKTVLLELSGGFDSSVVLSCAKRVATDTEIVNVNFWSPGSGDERIYAGSMATKTGTELLVRQRNNEVDLRRFLTCARTANPPVHFTAFDSEPTLVALAKQYNATAIVTGEIGDDIFGHAPFAGALAESLGWRKHFLGAVLDYALLTRLSFWKALTQAFEYRRWQSAAAYWSLYRYKQFYGLTDETSLASESRRRHYERELLPRFIHPWFRDVRAFPQGRVLLFWSLAQVTSTWFHSPFAGSEADLFINPLASQPLVEAFCKIPSALHFRDGESGALARAAFSSGLSEEVLGRGTGKGTPDEWIQRLIPQNREFLREVLLDGILIREGLLDRNKVEAVLSGAVSSSRVGLSELVMQLYVECWLRNWVEIVAEAAA